MKHNLSTSILSLLLILSLASCQKEFYLPTVPNTVIDSTLVGESEEDLAEAVLGEDVAKLNFIWVQTEGDYANLQGAKIEISDKNGLVVFSSIAVLEAGEEMFKWYPGIIMQADSYTFTLKSASGNVLSVSSINIASAFQQDEYMYQAEGAKYFLQLTWQKAD